MDSRHSFATSETKLIQGNSFSDLKKLQLLRSFYFPGSSVPSTFSTRHLQTHNVVYKRLAMDVSKLTKAGLSHGVDISLSILIRYVAHPDRAASVYGCAGRFSENLGEAHLNVIDNSDRCISCYVVFSPVPGTLATAAAMSSQGVDSLEIFFVYSQDAMIRQHQKTGNSSVLQGSQEG